MSYNIYIYIYKITDISPWSILYYSKLFFFSISLILVVFIVTTHYTHTHSNNRSQPTHSVTIPISIISTLISHSIMSQSLGWSISQWKDFTTSQPQDTVLATLQSLVASFSKEDPAWITIASPELIASQWSALVKLGPNAKTVSKLHFHFLQYHSDQLSRQKKKKKDAALRLPLLTFHCYHQTFFLSPC
jgi:hypothetical protein